MSDNKRRTSTQPFAAGDVVRQYHHNSMFDDALVTYAHSNGGLDVTCKGSQYGWSARTVVMSPIQDKKILDRPTKLHTFCNWLKNML
jgi:hypothetical protein